MKKLPLSAKTEIEESILTIRKLDVNLLAMYSPLRISFACLIITLIIGLAGVYEDKTFNDWHWKNIGDDLFPLLCLVISFGFLIDFSRKKIHQLKIKRQQAHNLKVVGSNPTPATKK